MTLLYRHTLSLLFVLFGTVFMPLLVQGQPCTGGTPAYVVNLTGRPDSTWISPSASRAGNCCIDNNCVEFYLTLDSGSTGIKFDIASGARPTGALYYQVGCGPLTTVGTELCLSGPGPHHITFCKPGNNPNSYKIQAIPKPDLKGKLIINQACIGFLQTQGLVDTSISWESVPYNTTYNTYLSSMHGVDSVSIIPTGNYPPTVTYRVCGLIVGGCASSRFCDTATVRFVTNIGVEILPKNPTVCFGGSNTTITATPLGGLAPYRYTWNTGDTSASISVGVGTYTVSMLDSLGCLVVKDSVVVTQFTMPIDANAGNDTTICTKNNKVLLNGIVQAASGGKWSGGTGTFVPNDTTLNAVYYPSVAETNAGTFTLKLKTTGNGSCPADSDFVQITILKTPTPTLIGPDSFCSFREAVYRTNNIPGVTRLWSVTGGTILTNTADTFIRVLWSGSATGTVSIQQQYPIALACDSILQRTIVILPTPAPVINGPASVCTNKLVRYSTNASSGNTYIWNVTGGTILGSATDTAVSILWGPVGSGNITLKQTSPFGCDSTVQLPTIIQPTPAPVIIGPSPVCAHKLISYSTNTTTGNSYLWSVTGGTISGVNNDSVVSILWGVSGTGIITLKQTNSFGCDSTVQRSITIQPTPVAVVNGPPVVCAYKTTTYFTNSTSGHSYNWTIAGGTVVSGTPTDTLISVRWGAAGTGTVTLKQTNSIGCDSTIVLSINIQPTPAPVITGPSPVCAYKTTSYSTNTTAGNSYLWTVAGGTILGSPTDSVISVLWGNTGTGTITLKQTNSLGCDSTVQRSITIQPTPAPVITGPAPVCAYKTTSYSTNTTAGNAYLWTVTGGTILGSPTDSVISVLWGNTGTGTITLKQTNSFGCDSTVQRSITIQPTPAPVITGPSPVCAYKTTSYSTNTTIGNSYLWTVTGGTILGSPTDSTISVLWGNTGTGSITLKQTNSLGCDSTVQRSITIQPTPAPVITGPAPVCAYKTTSYSTNTTAGNAYLWTVTGGTILASPTDSVISVLWGNTGTGTITIKQTNSFGCDSTIQRNITIQPTPAPVITGLSPVCAYKTTSYSTNTTNGNAYVWTVTGGTILGSPTDSVISVLWGNTGTGTITLKQTNSFGCDSTVQRSITIQPTPAPVITGPAPVCAYKTTSYSTNTTVGNVYVWTVTGGTILGSPTDSVISVLWGNTGTGIITLKQTNSLSCDSTVQRSITIQPTPAPVITGPAPVCAYKTTSYSTNTTVGNVYVWTVTGGTILGSPTDSVISVLWGNAGTGSITLKQTNSFGCDSTVQRSITIQPTPAPVITGPSPVCAYKTTSYSTNTTVGNAYLWTVSGGTILGVPTDSVISVLWGNTGTGTITLKQTNSLGCDSTVQRSITIQPTPAPVITGPAPVCAYKTTSYSTNTTVGNAYVWTVTGGAILGSPTDSVISVLWGNTGTGTITLKQTNSFGCDSTVQRSITIQPTPAPVITGPSPVCAYKPILYSTNTTVGNTYLWTVTGGTILGSSTDSVVTVSWGSTGTITLKQTNSLGCDSTVQRSITIQPTPAPVITGPALVCEHKTTSYSTNTTVGNIYVWTVTGGTLLGASTDTVISVLWGNTGTGTITLKQTNIFGCDSTVQRSITIQPTPAPVITGAAPVCAHKTNTYTTNTTAGNTYLWTVTGGTILGSPTDSVISILWGNAGTGSITLKQTNSFGCDSTVQRSITIQPTPAPVIAGPSPVCAYKTTSYSTNTTNGNSYLWTVTGGTILGSPADSVISVLWGNTGTGIISLKQTNSLGCDSTVQRSITIQPTPAPVITGPSPVCAYKTTSYSTNTTVGNVYVWTVTGGAILGSPTDSVISVLWGNTGTGTITLKQTNSFGCDSTVQRSITIQPTPAPVIGGPDSVCAYRNTVYSCRKFTGYNYQWTVLGGAILGSSTDTIITIKWDAAGTGQVALKQTNSFGCDSSVQKSIRINPTPISSIIADTMACAYTTTTSRCTTSINTQRGWSVTGGTIVGSSTDSIVKVKWAGAGTGQLFLHTTNAQGCDTTISFRLTIYPTPILTISGPDTICEQKMYTYTAGGTSNISYEWQINNGQIVGANNTQTGMVRFTALGWRTLILKGTSAAGCDTSITKNIYVQPTPTPGMNGPTVICAYKNAFYTTAKRSGHTYQWVAQGGIITGSSTDTAVLIRWTNQDTGIVYLTSTNTTGCDSTIKLKVIIKHAPLPLIVGPDTVCAYKTAVYKTPYTSGITYSWSASGGVLQQINDSMVSVRWGAQGTGWIRLYAVSPQGCDSVILKYISILPTPIPVISGPIDICSHSRASYSAPYQSGITYTWTASRGTIIGPSNQSSVEVLWGATGLGTLGLKLVSDRGCDSAIFINIFLRPTPEPAIIGPAITCTGTPTYIYTSNEIANARYDWIADTATILAGWNTHALTLKWPNYGYNEVKLTVTDTLTHCDSSVVYKVFTDTIIKPIVAAESLAGCAPLAITFSGNQLNPDYTYTWDFNDGGLSKLANPRYVFLNEGTYPVYVTVTNKNGCKDSALANVIVHKMPVSRFNIEHQNKIIYAFEDSVFFKNMSEGGNRFVWQIDNSTQDTINNPKSTFSRPGFYDVILTTIDTVTGCTSTSIGQFEVRLHEELFVPNAFTPNGDGINDYFYVSTFNIVEFELIIFDRWGKILFKTNDKNFQWDGNYGGLPAQSDVYGYLVTGIGYHGHHFSKAGNVTLLR